MLRNKGKKNEKRERQEKEKSECERWIKGRKRMKRRERKTEKPFLSSLLSLPSPFLSHFLPLSLQLFFLFLSPTLKSVSEILIISLHREKDRKLERKKRKCLKKREKIKINSLFPLIFSFPRHSFLVSFLLFSRFLSLLEGCAKCV